MFIVTKKLYNYQEPSSPKDNVEKTKALNDEVLHIDEVFDSEYTYDENLEIDWGPPQGKEVW